MEINTTQRQINAADASVIELIRFLEASEEELSLQDAQLYYDFPLFRDYDDTVVISRILLVSRVHGVVIIGTSNVSREYEAEAKIHEVNEELNRVFDILFARLIRNPSLKKARQELMFNVTPVIYAPYLDQFTSNTDISICVGDHSLADTLYQLSKTSAELSEATFVELIATVEGSKGLVRAKARATENPNSMGAIVKGLESQIASFDKNQKHGSMAVLEGIERIRGLAGSGKTIVLAMKAALTHIRNPDATILYTFWTKSLYQHIQQIITRFYRNWVDQDPDWSKLKIMHGWGGTATEGVYYDACIRFGHRPLTFSEARAYSSLDPFEFACSELVNKTAIFPIYDYVFVDEGQDFPSSFLKLCVEIANNHSMVYAYDELQTIFRTKAVSPSEFAPEYSLAEDIILYKCYRNPREILVCAHALGFGLYSDQIVQMLENKDHWEDVGYEVISGDFVAGSKTIVERPKHNSLGYISEKFRPSQIVQANTYNDFDSEIEAVITSIKQNLEDGLLPEDILVLTADDRNAKAYLYHISKGLEDLEVNVNNIHDDTFGLRNFQKEQCVTLSTIHKAKGNEAYMVYVLGVDALFASPKVRERNLIFTAMTRAKAWLRVSGVGTNADYCRQEIQTALSHFPRLVFNYPSEEDLKVMQRDLAAPAIQKMEIERKLDELFKTMSQEEVERLIRQRNIKKGRK